LYGFVARLLRPNTLFNGRDIFGPVDTRGVISGDDHLDSITVLQHSELLQLFNGFQGGMGKRGDGIQKIFFVGIESQVLVNIGRCAFVSYIWDLRP